MKRETKKELKAISEDVEKFQGEIRDRMRAICDDVPMEYYLGVSQSIYDAMDGIRKALDKARKV